MDRRVWVGLVAGGIVVLGGIGVARPPSARAQRARAEAPPAAATAWEYKVAVLSYNPGERLTDDQRAAAFAKLLNDEAGQGWEPVGSLLSRDTAQTVGGAVTTRQTTSFVALRRPRR